MIWRPNHGGQSGPQDFFLELNFTDETLEFTDITGATGIANRGFLQDDIPLGGVAYLQSIKDSFDGTGQHFEPGVWVNVPSTTDPNEPATIVRMGSIPHGTTINLQGRAFSVPQPQFDVASITPFKIDHPDQLVPFPEENLSTASQSRTPPNRVAGLTQTQLDNPNLFLSTTIAPQTILSTPAMPISALLIRMSSRSAVAWASSARRRTSASAERSAARKSAEPPLALMSATTRARPRRSPSCFPCCSETCAFRWRRV